MQFPLTYGQDILSSQVSPISRLHEFFFFPEGTVALLSGDGPTDVRTVSPPFLHVFSSAVRGPSSSSTARKSKLLLLFQDRGSEAPSQKASLFGSFPLVAPQHRCSLGSFILPFPDLGKICSPSGERIGPFFSIWTSFWCVLDSALAEDCIAPSK